MHKAASAVLTVLVLLMLCGCGGNSGSSGPQPQPEQRFAGVWTISCMQQAPDCAAFSVTVDDSGALVDATVPGFTGVVPGNASIDVDNDGNQVLRINISDTYIFEGNYTGLSASGTLTITDLEKGNEMVAASAELSH